MKIMVEGRTNTSGTVHVVNPNHPVVPYMPSLFTYSPSSMIPRGSGQTLFAAIARTKIDVPPMTRHIVQAHDGGELCLDWSNPNTSESTRLLVLVPGVTGNIEESKYIRFICRDAHAAGWDIVVLTFRGLFGRPIVTPKLTFGVDREDIQQLLMKVVESSTHPDCVRVVAGVSMGGNMLVNFISSAENATTRDKFLGAMSISNPFHFPASAQRLHSTYIGRFFSSDITKSLQERVTHSLHLFNKPTNMEGTDQATCSTDSDEKTDDVIAVEAVVGAQGPSRIVVLTNDTIGNEDFPKDLLDFPTLHNASPHFPPRQLPRLFPHLPNIPLAMKATSISQFDHVFTAPLLGYSSLLDYYHNASSVFAIPSVPTTFPLFIITSHDDHFVSTLGFPYTAAAAHPAVVVADCEIGGHIGFAESLSPTASSWAERLVLEYANALCRVNNVEPPPSTCLEQQQLRIFVF
eukprot:c9108_g1_i1.p1 GENE.c9108_g1_i1~~c9108_g1_i1.p1  ORF type:complete len:488 (+),score=100.13 c9108_g1_i1:81-1466(+)